MANAKFSQGMRDSMIDSTTNVADAFISGFLEIRDGTQPANANTAPTGTVLASVELPATPWLAVSDGVLALTGTWEEASAPAAGTATWFRLRTSGDLGTTNTTDIRVDGDVTTVAAGTGDLQMSATVIALTDKVTVDTFTITVPA